MRVAETTYRKGGKRQANQKGCLFRRQARVPKYAATGMRETTNVRGIMRGTVDQLEPLLVIAHLPVKSKNAM